MTSNKEYTQGGLIILGIIHKVAVAPSTNHSIKLQDIIIGKHLGCTQDTQGAYEEIGHAPPAPTAVARTTLISTCEINDRQAKYL
ncbi:hypothetical protein E2C01_019513 [Portunus trituberculatus]|uniref:Uncharacterized protein n=1 Tax=Portunus trituberculatus TaxID=210409 RepID=A0A5B7DY41_PORTR|nr:hypothetical protein [Portunus trituberculatus]